MRPGDWEWIGATFNPPDAQSAEQKLALGESDVLVAELQAGGVDLPQLQSSVCFP